MEKTEEPVAKAPDAPLVPELKAGDPNSLQELTALVS
uniref:Uncharacterized protein n=1 Tax=Parascaris equorum TaxID=6256 RepID=A0A914R9N2_PAREQ